MASVLVKHRETPARVPPAGKNDYPLRNCLFLSLIQVFQTELTVLLYSLTTVGIKVERTQLSPFEMK